MNVPFNEKGLPIPKTTWRLDPVLKLFQFHSLIHNSLICHKFLFRNLSAFLHLYFHFCWFGCYWLQPKTGSSVFKTIQNHFQNWITFFAHFRPLKDCNISCRIISPLKLIRKTPASPRFTKTIILLFRYLVDGKWVESSSYSWNSDDFFLIDCLFLAEKVK